MRNCLIAIALCLPGCAAGQVVWPHIVTCATTAAGPLVNDVSQILLGGGDVASQLEALAETQGVDVVACVVNQLVNAWTAANPSGLEKAEDPAHAAAAERGKAFLESHGINVE